MEHLPTAAWMLRYAARSLAHNLEFIPEDRANWKPHEGAKTPLEIATEAIRVMRMYQPLFAGPDFDNKFPAPDPTTLKEAGTMLVEAAMAYSAQLEAAGTELDRPQDMPFGGTFRADRAVCFPLMDVLHHHGQICYLQSLLGDKEMHWDEAAIRDEFERHAAESGGAVV